MTTVSLINAGREPFIVVLDHTIYCAGGGPCECKREQFRTAAYEPDISNRARRGKVFKGFMQGKRVVPKSVTIFPKTKRGGFHPAVLRLPTVKDSVKTGWLRKIEETASAPTPPPPQPVVVPPAPIGRRGAKRVGRVTAQVKEAPSKPRDQE